MALQGETPNYSAFLDFSAHPWRDLRIAGMARSYFRPVQTLLTSVYMAMPSSPFSRPRPDIL